MIIAGPWVGEFGWELFCWQGYLRALHESIIVVSQPGHEELYRDFAVEFIGMPNPPTGWSDCSRLVGGGPRMMISGWELAHLKPDDWFYWGKPITIPGYHDACTPEFIRYGRGNTKDAYDVVLCARGRMLKKERNWHQWEDLVMALGGGRRVCVIGKPIDSMHVVGADDRRGEPLSSVVNILASSRLAIGPSTGSLHLAALCDCPRLVWDGIDGDAPRYLEHWNPFRVETQIIPKWQPSVDEVYEKVKEMAL